MSGLSSEVSRTEAGVFPERDSLFSELEGLKQLVEDLHDQREEDRQSIRILQSQIDSMRDVKCSDSFDQSLHNIKAMAINVWNQLPSVQLDGFISAFKRRKRKVLKSLPVNGSCSTKGDTSRQSMTKGSHRKESKMSSTIPRDS